MTATSNTGMSTRNVKELIEQHLSGEQPDQDTPTTDQTAVALNGPGIESSLRAALGLPNPNTEH